MPFDKHTVIFHPDGGLPVTDLNPFPVTISGSGGSLATEATLQDILTQAQDGNVLLASIEAALGSVGGGTEYLEGDAVPSITGPSIVFRDSSGNAAAWETGPTDNYPGVELYPNPSSPFPITIQDGGGLSLVQDGVGVNTVVKGASGASINDTTEGAGQSLDVHVTNPDLTVTVGAELPAGTQIIGTVGIDQTTDGTTNGVSVTTPIALKNDIGEAIDDTHPLAVKIVSPPGGSVANQDADYLIDHINIGGYDVDQDELKVCKVDDGVLLVKATIDQTTDGTTNGVSVTNATIEQTTGEVHNDLNLAVGGKDGSGNVQPIHTDTSGDVQVDILSSALPTGAATEATLSTLNGKVTACNTGAVVVSSSALPTGAATAANQSTIIGHVDGIETVLGTIDTDTGNIATSVGVMDDWDESDRCKVNLPALSISRNIDIDESGDSQVGTACKLYGWFIHNKNAATLYLKLYNKASAPTVGADTPVMTIPLSAGAAANVSFPNGITFSLGLGVGATTGVADADTGAPGANDLVGNFFYI